MKEFRLTVTNEEEESGDKKDYEEVAEHKRNTSKNPCNKCLGCSFVLLYKLNLHIWAYSNLHRTYEYFMILPCTQVTCERGFSKLKIIKSHLWSAMIQQL